MKTDYKEGDVLVFKNEQVRVHKPTLTVIQELENGLEVQCESSMVGRDKERCRQTKKYLGENYILDEEATAASKSKRDLKYS